MDKHILRLYIYSSRKAAALLFLASTFLYVFREDAVAQQATIGSYGCGTGCAISIEQLASPQRIGNGWSKVLVKETTRFYGPDGRETSFRGIQSGQSEKFWQFAKCDGDVIGKGFKSDGSDATTMKIFDEDGRKIYYNAGGQAYSKWEALCNSPH